MKNIFLSAAVVLCAATGALAGSDPVVAGVPMPFTTSITVFMSEPGSNQGVPQPDGSNWTSTSFYIVLNPGQTGDGNQPVKRGGLNEGNVIRFTFDVDP